METSQNNPLITIKEIKSDEEIDNLVEMIMRHTQYEREEAKTHLENENYDAIKVIKKFVVGDRKPKEQVKKSSTNQKVMTELRNLMDDINEGFMKRQKEKKTINKTI